jgi:TonB family protein
VGEQAVSVVLKHYAVNPLELDPKTHTPLSGGGSWSMDKRPAASCPESQNTCVTVQYRLPDEQVQCSWLVLLNEDGSDGAILDENDDAARYMLRKVSAQDAGALITFRKKPSFPPIAMAAHISGTVSVEVIVDQSGKIQKTFAVSGPPMERGAALEAAQDWRFKPMLVGSRAVPYVVPLLFTFRTMGPASSSVSVAP